MIDWLIKFLLIVGINLPIYFELYKHILKQKGILAQIILTVIYWVAAYETQILAAFISVIYMYSTIYSSTKSEADLREIDVWHIRAVDAALIAFGSTLARVLIAIINLIYVVVLDKLLKYDIKPQDIVTYYTEADWILKFLLAIEIVIIAPVVEEFVFRFFLYDKVFVNRMPRYAAAFISAALFTLVHFNVSGIPTFFGLGLFCAYMYEKKGYWGAVTAHGMSNALTLIFLKFF